MVQVWHVLFLACLPVAIVLAIAGQWVAAAAVLIVGVPVFWNLRNRAAQSAMSLDPLTVELRGAPQLYTLPPEVDRRLSARNLDDVPESVRVGSPHDASDEAVRDTLRKLGVLNPRTNYGVVYRCCFAPFLEESERPQVIRFGWASLAVGPKGRVMQDREQDIEQAWILVTDLGVYWHQVSDHVPGMPPRGKVEGLLAPKRWVNFGPTVKVMAHQAHEGPGGIPLRSLTLDEEDENSLWRAILFLGADPQTDGILEYVMQRAEASR
jgi:hypothetical protein